MTPGNIFVLLAAPAVMVLLHNTRQGGPCQLLQHGIPPSQSIPHIHNSSPEPWGNVSPYAGCPWDGFQGVARGRAVPATSYGQAQILPQALFHASPWDGG